MSVAQTRSARRKIRLRYGVAGQRKTVADSIQEERLKAARQAAAAKKK